MEDLQIFKVNEDSERITLSARDLYKALQITDRFARWFDRMTAYGFENGTDFTSVKSSTVVNNGAEIQIDDYAISIELA